MDSELMGTQLAHAGLTFTEKIFVTCGGALIVIGGLWLIWWIRKNTR